MKLRGICILEYLHITNATVFCGVTVIYAAVFPLFISISYMFKNQALRSFSLRPKHIIKTLVWKKDTNTHTATPKYIFFKSIEMFTYCSATTSTVSLAETKENKNIGEDVDNNCYILLSTFHAPSLQSQQKKLFLGHFTNLRQKEDNCNTNFLTSQDFKKLLITFPY